eukprot:gnl/MRDRNA2_/MRDRNA2_108653_c0_seq1.p1 gnl/MRDRNA2_/MRDRNA2_108653_c0~~gnl/MRDRNA2_/MRDRNA2_108653_c0_seq1.p1  ORF type:complete len:515 (+),score=140.55 gnl/MRDRNA2_/MRDRNA2_108653_c0_seq1:80-1546(+)
MPPKGKAAGKPGAKAKASAKAKPDTNTFDVEKMLSYVSAAERDRLNSEDFKKEAESAFETADVSGTGTLDGPEIPSAVFKVVGGHRAAFLQITSANAEELLMHFDADGNGKIDKAEFHNFVKWLVAKEIVDYFSGESQARHEEGVQKLAEVLDDLVKCYDASENGSIERVDLLEAEEKIEGFLQGIPNTQLGVKERKALVAWFKECGAEGNPTDGMFLAFDKFKQNFPKRFAARLKVSDHLDERVLAYDPEVHPGLFADFLRVRIVDPFLKLRFPKAYATADAGEGGDGGPVKPPPTYPITVTLKEMGPAMDEARAHQLPVLIVQQGVAEVETFLSYQSTSCFDCKQAINELFVSKKKTQDEVKEEVRTKLRDAIKGQQNMDGASCFPKPLWFRLSNSAFALSDYIDDEKCLPIKVFEKGFGSAAAHACKLIDDAEKLDLEISNDKKIKDNFALIITSAMTLDGAQQHLKDKIPNFDQFAIIVIQPLE